MRTRGDGGRREAPVCAADGMGAGPIWAGTGLTLAEARRITPEPGMVEHLHRVHDRICAELRASLPTGLYEELSALTPDVADGSLQELVLAHAEIIGWLQGLFQAIQLTMTQARNVLPQTHRPADGPDRPDPRYL